MFDTFKDYIMTFFYKVKYGIKNIFIWFPIIWKDRNYDSIYLFKLLDFKLKLISNEMKGKFIGAEEEIEQINSIRDAIKRLIKDDYCHDEWIEHKEKFGNIIHFIEKENKFITVKYSKCLTNDEEKKGDEELFRIFELEEERRKQDIEFIFNNIKNNILKWWV